MRKTWILVVSLLMANCRTINRADPVRLVPLGFTDGEPVDPTATLVVSIEPALPDDAQERLEVALTEGGCTVPITVDRARVGAIAVTPRRALRSQTLHTLRVAESTFAFTTGTLGSSPPVLTLVTPEEGATEVIRNPRRIEVRYSRAVARGHEVTLVDGAGRNVSARTRLGPTCVDCVAIEPDEPLASGMRYEVRASNTVRDERGRLVFGDGPWFVTGVEVRTTPVQIQAVESLASDGCLVVRFRADVAAAAELCCASKCEFDAPGFSHELSVLVDESAGDPAWFELRAWDESTVAPATTGAVSFSLPSSVPLTISEVMLDPSSFGVVQQYVMVRNDSSAPVSLEGLTLHDESGYDVLAEATLGGGATLRIVPRSYVEMLGEALLRLDDDRLGGSGFRRSGELVWLADRAGKIVSALDATDATLAVGQAAKRNGRCAKRSNIGP